MKKVYALLLALLLCIPAFTSCAAGETAETADSSGTADTQPAEQETTRANYPDSLPELDFNGENLAIHVRGDSVGEFYIEELTGEMVDDSIYERNQMVEDRLNITIEVVPGETWEGYNNSIAELRSSISAGDGAFDLIAGWSARIPALSLEGLFMDLFQVPYIDFEKPWWNESVTTDLQIAGKLHFATGDIVISMLEPMCVYVVNQKVAEDYGIENLYTVVKEHRWTIDYVRTLVADMYVDLDGNGAYDPTDMYGFLCSSFNDADGYMQGFRVSMVSRDEEGLPVLDVDKERLSTIVDKLYNLMWNTTGTYASTSDTTDLTHFAADRALLASSRLYFVKDQLAEMESDYGILPYPLLNEAQEKYGTRVQDSLTLMCVPIDIKNPELSGAAMEALAAQAYRTVTPAVFDVALKNRYSRDPESAEMIDLIKDSILLNFESLYNESIGNPWFVLRDLMPTKSADFASYWAKKENNIATQLDKAVEQIKSQE